MRVPMFDKRRTRMLALSNSAHRAGEKGASMSTFIHDFNVNPSMRIDGHLHVEVRTS
jgi:hypothetical protein